MITPGAWGAGKSAALASVVRADLVLDGAFSYLPWARKVIHTAIDNGWVVHLNHVTRPMELVASGVLERGMNEGRVAPLDKIVKAHRESQAAAVKLEQEFGLRI